MKNCITERCYAAIRMTLKTPLCIGGDGTDNTDRDIIRDGKGEPFIPGSSVAGAIRDFLGLAKDKEGEMGYSLDEDGKMSPVFVYDMKFNEEPVVITRDFVALDHDKIAKPQGKFDMEVIDSGAKTTLYLEGINRQDTSYLFKDIFERIADGFNSGEIRLGAKKNRGFGWLQVTEAKTCSFKEKRLNDWINFVPRWKTEIFESSNARDILLGRISTDKYIDIILPLKLTGGISIRVYSAEPGKADFSHITSNGKPVIPGSGWNGALRERAYDILMELGMDEKKIEKLRGEWFGYVDIEKRKASQSRIIYEESVIDGGASLPVVRNRIDRFDQGTVGTALFTEKSQFGGTTKLHIKIRKKGDDSDKVIMGILLLLFDDIKDGYVSVGGQTAIGRGVFESNGEAEISGAEFTREECLSALYAELAEGREE